MEEKPGAGLPDPAPRDYDIRIARDGTWYHEGRPIRRPELVRLFASVLRRGEDGCYWLVTPAERGRIMVDEVPFVAVALEIVGSGPGQALLFRTNVGQEVAAGPDHPIRVETDDRGEPRPYLTVSEGLDARIARPVYYDLVERAVPHPALEGAQGSAGADGEIEFGVWSRHGFFTLGRLPSG